ncbi:MAG: PorP/SprF family type IX secretion system membrane protein [Bacteroidota bacterium]|nr:PorP/SprF family type IX secretion system membrane protein [Bacteroidota bacterium]
MKSVKVTLFVFILNFQVFGQQVPQFSQYMYERFLYNPAYAGTNPNAIEVALNFRRQNVGYFGQGEVRNLYGGVPMGYDDKSISSINNFAIHSPLRKINMAVGARLIRENISFYDFTGFWGTAAYQFKFPKSKFSIGSEFGVIQSLLRSGDLLLDNSNDKAIVNNSSPTYAFLGNYTPDIGFGVYYNRKFFYAGVSLAHAFPFRLTPNTSNYSRDVYATLSRHYNAIVGGSVAINPQFSLEPSGLFKMIENGAYQYDASLMVNYKDVVSMGSSYRSQKAVVGIIKITFYKNIHLSYSYDYVFAQLGRFSSGSHEVLFRYVVVLNPLAKKYIVDPRHYY